MYCFYHKADLDGHCAGAIVKYFRPKCDLIGVDYLDTFPTIEKGEIVFVVDFCFSLDDMIYLNEQGALTWIDHHKSSMEKMKAYEEVNPINGKRAIGKSGCELAWSYFSNEPPPLAVTLLGRYDVWDHKDPRTLPFQYGMRNFDNTKPDSHIWPVLFEEVSAVNNFLLNGNIIEDYQIRQYAKMAKSLAYETLFNGLRAIVLNIPFANSQAFDTVYDPEKHDIMVLFSVAKEEPRFKYSLYTHKPEIDVSDIAKRFGGGGHKGAAGFYSKNLWV